VAAVVKEGVLCATLFFSNSSEGASLHIFLQLQFALIYWLLLLVFVLSSVSLENLGKGFLLGCWKDSEQCGDFLNCW
jgi:hypothetical protein